MTTFFQIAGIVLGAGLLGIALGALLYSIAESLRRAAVLPLAVRYASSRLINVVPPLGIAIGVAALIIVISVMNGFIAEQRKLIRGTLADLTIRPAPVSKGPDGKRGMPGRFEDYRRILQDTPGVVATAPRFMWAAMIFPPEVLDIYNLAQRGSEFVVELRGIDPDAERRVSEFEKWVGPLGADDPGVTDAERAWYQPVRDPKNPFAKYAPEGRLEKDTAVVGVSLARNLRLARDTRLEFSTFSPASTREKPVPANKLFHVSGMFHTQEQDFDVHTVLVSIPALQSFLADDSTDFTEIAVKLENYTRVGEMRRAIGERLRAAGLVAGTSRLGSSVPYSREIISWEEQKATLLAAVDNERGILGFMLFTLVVVAAFIQFATLSMMVTEKTRDIGILATLGASSGEILAVFVDVGVAMTVVGAALGLGLAWLVTANLNRIDGLIEVVSGRRIFNPEVYFLKTIPSEVDPVQVAWILALTLTAGVLASLAPAVRAARLHPAAALRYE